MSREKKTLRLTDADCRQATISGSYDSVYITAELVDSCTFDKFTVKEGQLSPYPVQTVFRNCTFRKCRFRMQSVGWARFENCVFEDIDWRKTFMFKTDIVNCKFIGGRLLDLVINGESGGRHGEPLHVNQIEDNDFSQTSLEGVGFRRGVDLTKQVLPTGPGYIYWPDAGEAMVKARAALDMLPDDSELREYAGSLVTVTADNYSDGQVQDFMYVPRLCRSQELADEVFEFFHRVTVAE